MPSFIESPFQTKAAYDAWNACRPVCKDAAYRKAGGTSGGGASDAPAEASTVVAIDEALKFTTAALKKIGWDDDDAKPGGDHASAETCGNNQVRSRTTSGPQPPMTPQGSARPPPLSPSTELVAPRVCVLRPCVRLSGTGEDVQSRAHEASPGRLETDRRA